MRSLNLLCCLIFTFGYAQYPNVTTIVQKLNNSESKDLNWFNTIMELGEAYRPFPISHEVEAKGMPHSYLDYALEALDWAKTNASNKEVAQAKRFLIDYYCYGKEPLNFIGVANDMVEDDAFASLQDKHFVYVKLNEIYKEMGFLDKYIELIPEQYEVARQLKLKSSLAHDENSNIGLAYFGLKEYDKAIDYFKTSTKLLNKERKHFAQASITNNIGLAYARMNKNDSAKVYLNKAIDLLKDADAFKEGFERTSYTQHFKNVIKANIAYLDFDKGNYEPIIEAIKTELASAQVVSEIVTEIQAYNKLGKLYFLKKDYVQALKYLKLAQEKMRINSDNELKIENLKWQAKLLLALGKHKESEVLFNQKNKLQDSITSVKANRTASVASVLYETEKKEKEIQKQKLIVSQKTNEISRRSRMQLVYGISSAALLILLISGVYLYRKLKEQKLKIQDQKVIVDKSLKEKEILLREVHHRVKNNLQIVSSLLSVQANSTEDESLIRLMDEGQNRIKSMAMIHQQLYQTDHLADITLNDYSRMLIANIDMSNRSREAEILHEIDIPEIKVDMDVAVPYGLILNELLTNCYKYGLKEKIKGTIRTSVISVDADYYKLSVSDDGHGISISNESESKSSFGLNLVRGLSQQLRGNLNYYNLDQGSVFEVVFRGCLKEA